MAVKDLLSTTHFGCKVDKCLFIWSVRIQILVAQESQLDAEVVAAVDINNVTNGIYKHNFPDTAVLARCIENLSVKELGKLSPDLIHMSPPCQPFTRVGKQQDAGDIRTKSFLHLIDVIPQMRKKPKYIFVENVRGFDSSETRSLMLSMLEERGYICQEFLLSPVQFGIPNSRLRYYMMAKHEGMQFGFDTKQQIWEELPACANCYLVDQAKQSTILGCHGDGGESSFSAGGESCNKSTKSTSHLQTSHLVVKSSSGNIADNCEERTIDLSPKDLSSVKDKVDTSQNSKTPENTQVKNCDLTPLYKKYEKSCQTVGNFLEKGSEEYFEKFLVPSKFLRHFWVMDIVQSDSKNCCCFTKRYAHHIDGAGSTIQTAAPSGIDLSQYKQDKLYNDEVETGVLAMKLRFFTPREIANLMCFPPHFGFPADVSTMQCYRSLGNSLNVHVVAVLLRLLLMGDNLQSQNDQTCMK